MIDIEWWLTICRFLLESSGAFHSTKTSEKLETVANGTKISRENFQKVRELLNFWDANHSTESPENSLSKVERKENFSKIWVYHATLSGFVEIPKNTVPFDTGSCRNVVKSCKKTGSFGWIKNARYLPGRSRRLAPVLKCRRFLSFFQRHIVRDISLAHWNLIRHFEKHEAWRTVKRKIIAFWGRTRSPTFTMH